MSNASQPDPQEGATEQPAVAAVGTVHVAGEVLGGKYRLDRLLGQGGMGSVWRARSLILEIDVAVKLVPPDAAGSDGARLLREARAAASLGHPNIVRILDFGATDRGEPFLVMELLEGRSLGALLDERSRIPATAAVRLMLPVVSALASAHARGIVHRDIKPDNIVLVPVTVGDTPTPLGDAEMLVPKLVDFGIVKLQASPDVATLTDRGTLIGSAEYMSPEQARGLVDVDAKTDIWSVCVVLYELITGNRPFTGPNHGAVLYAIFSADPEPTVARAAGDDALWEILARGLEKAPADRWPDARALGRELAAWAEAQGITTDAAGMSIAEKWLGRSSSVDLAHALGSPHSRQSNADVPTGKLSPSVRDPHSEPPRSRRPGARDVAVGAALVVALGIGAFSMMGGAARPPRTPLVAVTMGGAQGSLQPPLVASGAPPVASGGGEGPEAPPVASVSARSPLVQAPRPKRSPVSVPRRPGKTTTLPLPDF